MPRYLMAAAAFYGFSVYRQQVLIPKINIRQPPNCWKAGNITGAGGGFGVKYREGADLETSGDWQPRPRYFESLEGIRTRSRYKECTY
ncbi:MAG: hypothetical protein ACLS8R_06940 [Anaeromassilibacillus sp.]